MAGPGPNPVFPTMRHELIMQLARTEGRVGVAELAEKLDVTKETVRRDLITLERMGLLRRVHGGALPVQRVTEGHPAEDGHGMVKEKERIAAAALDLLPETGTILVDSGTTMRAFARLLPPERELTVVTNDLVVAQQVGRNDRHEVIVVGGVLDERTQTLVGPFAEAMLAPLLVDVCFLGTSGMSVARGLTTQGSSLASVKAAMMRSARRHVLLADHSKVGADYFQRFASLDEIDVLVTDSALDAETATEFRVQGLEVRLA